MAHVRASDFIRHGALVLAASLVTNAFNYIFHFIVSRKLGIDGYGALSAMIALLTISAVPSVIAATVVARLTAEYRAREDSGRLYTLTWRTTVACSLIAAVVAALAAAASGAIARYLQIADSRAIVILALALGMSLVLPVVRGVLQGVQDFASFAMSAGIESVGKAILGAAFALGGFGLIGALGGYVVGEAAALVFTVLRLRADVRGPGNALTLDPRAFLTSSAGIAVSTACLTVLAFADVMLVKHFFPPETAGLYAVVSLIGKIMLYTLSFVPTVILPKATTLATHGRSPRLLLAEAGAIMLGIAGVGLAIVYFAPVAVITTVAGKAFVPATHYLFPYTIAMTMLAVSGGAAAYKISLHRYGFVAYLAAMMVLEIFAIHLWHQSLDQVLLVILLGHGIACLGSVYRIDTPVTTTASRLMGTMEAAKSTPPTSLARYFSPMSQWYLRKTRVCCVGWPTQGRDLAANLFMP